MLFRSGGAKGVLHASQISVGEENALNIRVYGEKGGLEWHQEHPNELIVKYPDRPSEIWRRGNGYVGDTAKKFTRIPSGHPEGYLEGFAQIYADAATLIRAHDQKRKPEPSAALLPTAEDGLRGMRFIAATVEIGRAHV